jgi:predicted DNA binding CopG/RHH family protein
MKRKRNEIIVYDNNDTTNFIDKNKPLSLNDLGLKLPSEGTTKIISIRLPTQLYNKLKAFSTKLDIPYQAYIKYLLNQGLEKDLKKMKGTDSDKLKKAS